MKVRMCSVRGRCTTYFAENDVFDANAPMAVFVYTSEEDEQLPTLTSDTSEKVTHRIRAH